MLDLWNVLQLALMPENLLALGIGVIFGTMIGALPGLGTAVAITIAIPFTLKMGNTPAIALLLGIYASSIYGGSITAVLLNTPGTPQSACTGLEGYPMARAGKASQALGWVTMSSVIGGLISCVALIVATPQLAAISVKYGGPLEICALICMGLACITSLSEGNQIKGMLMGVAGLFIATIGIDPVSGTMRFTFGSQNLIAGIDLMPVVVGVFPLAELFYRVYEVHAHVEPQPIDCRKISFPRLKEWKGKWQILIRSSLIGIGLGALPGTGATAATFVSYSTAKRISPNGDNFGKGEPDGLIAAESSNNAVSGGALVPTLALGIPGEPVMALMLATLTIHGITPGVRLMADTPDIVYAMFLLLIFANLLLIPAAMLTVLGFGKLIRFPTAILLGPHRNLLRTGDVPAKRKHVRRMGGAGHRNCGLFDALRGFPRGSVHHWIRSRASARVSIGTSDALQGRHEYRRIRHDFASGDGAVCDFRLVAFGSADPGFQATQGETFGLPLKEAPAGV